LAIEQTLKSGSTVTEMDTDDAVIDLPTTAQPLPVHADGLVSALGGSRFIDTTDGVGMGVLASDQVLTGVTQRAVVPLDGLQQPL
jgi:hypothetical protein